jgi:hypothetical protein
LHKSIDNQISFIYNWVKEGASAMGSVEAFLKIRCPNKPVDGSTFECRGNLAGFAISFLNSSVFPITDLRYCNRCGSFVLITIDSLTSQPRFKILSEAEKEHIPFKSMEELFGGYSVEGRYVKRGDAKHE